MGYAIYETPMGDAGYAVSDICHEEGCTEKIDRGVAYLCGDQPGYQSEYGCGRWFCGEHMYGGPEESLGGHCRACRDAAAPEEARRDGS